MKHTPEPWYYKDGMIYTQDGETIATVKDLGPEQDNGPLIAAAPDLLKALEESVIFLGMLLDCKEDAEAADLIVNHGNEVESEAREAIAKAKP